MTPNQEAALKYLVVRRRQERSDLIDCQQELKQPGNEYNSDLKREIQIRKGKIRELNQAIIKTVDKIFD